MTESEEEIAALGQICSEAKAAARSRSFAAFNAPSAIMSMPDDEPLTNIRAVSSDQVQADGYVRVWLKPEIFKCYRKSCELTKDEVYFSWGWGDDQNHGISYKTGEFGSFVTGTIRDFPSGTPDLHNGNVSQAVCGTIICWEADQSSSEWYDKLILAIQELSRMAKSLAHDVGGGALNALIGQLPGFSQYADMMFWIENVAMVIGAFLEIFRNKDDKVAEHNYGFNREFLRRYQRPDSFIDFSFDGGSGGNFSLFARALIGPDMG
ncbi:unnamed protein product [Fusarium graminearum]|nr:unnamed protein product [Fusarium graminearum]